MAKDERGLHIQTEQEFQTQLEHTLADLGRGSGHELSDAELAALPTPSWVNQ